VRALEEVISKRTAAQLFPMRRFHVQSLLTGYECTKKIIFSYMQKNEMVQGEQGAG
jgi:hypothetical protein